MGRQPETQTNAEILNEEGPVQGMWNLTRTQQAVLIDTRSRAASQESFWSLGAYLLHQLELKSKWILRLRPRLKGNPSARCRCANGFHFLFSQACVFHISLDSVAEDGVLLNLREIQLWLYSDTSIQVSLLKQRTLSRSEAQDVKWISLEILHSQSNFLFLCLLF